MVKLDQKFIVMANEEFKFLFENFAKNQTELLSLITGYCVLDLKHIDAEFCQKMDAKMRSELETNSEGFEDIVF